MEIIDQSVEILDRTNQMKIIELAGRTCWKSESKIHDNSCDNFVKNIIKAKHFSVIEHGIACMKIYDTSMITHLQGQKFITIQDIYAIGNYRAWLEFIESKHCYLNEVLKTVLHKIEPVIFQTSFGGICAEKYIQEASWDEIPRNQHYITARFITDRSVTHEFVRHRNNIAFSQESQRYVNYKNGIQYIRQIDIPNEQLKNHFIQNERQYALLIKLGHKPQHARSILMNAVKTEMVVTANIEEWQHIIKLRTSKAAHPQIKSLINNFKKRACL